MFTPNAGKSNKRWAVGGPILDSRMNSMIQVVDPWVLQILQGKGRSQTSIFWSSQGQVRSNVEWSYPKKVRLETLKWILHDFTAFLGLNLEAPVFICFHPFSVSKAAHFLWHPALRSSYVLSKMPAERQVNSRVGDGNGYLSNWESIWGFPGGYPL